MRYLILTLFLFSCGKTINNITNPTFISEPGVHSIYVSIEVNSTNNYWGLWMHPKDWGYFQSSGDFIVSFPYLPMNYSIKINGLPSLSTNTILKITKFTRMTDGIINTDGVWAKTNMGGSDSMGIVVVP